MNQILASISVSLLLLLHGLPVNEIRDAIDLGLQCFRAGARHGLEALEVPLRVEQVLAEPVLNSFCVAPNGQLQDSTG